MILPLHRRIFVAFSQELNEWHESSSYYEFTPPSAEKKPVIKVDSVKLFADKLRIPKIAEPIARPPLMEHLSKSLAQFSATLIAGRAGTGKTVLAADFARNSDGCVAWYKVETADSDWKVFYVSACVISFLWRISSVRIPPLRACSRSTRLKPRSRNKVSVQMAAKASRLLNAL